MGAVQFKQSLMNMNFYIILTTFFLGAVSASNAVTCDECRKASVDLDVHLLSEESLGEQILSLNWLCVPSLRMWPLLLTTWSKRIPLLRVSIISRVNVSVADQIKITLKNVPQ